MVSASRCGDNCALFSVVIRTVPLVSPDLPLTPGYTPVTHRPYSSTHGQGRPTPCENSADLPCIPPPSSSSGYVAGCAPATHPTRRLMLLSPTIWRACRKALGGDNGAAPGSMTGVKKTESLCNRHKKSETNQQVSDFHTSEEAVTGP